MKRSLITFLILNGAALWLAKGQKSDDPDVEHFLDDNRAVRKDVQGRVKSEVVAPTQINNSPIPGDSLVAEESIQPAKEDEKNSNESDVGYHIKITPVRNPFEVLSSLRPYSEIIHPYEVSNCYRPEPRGLVDEKDIQMLGLRARVGSELTLSYELNFIDLDGERKTRNSKDSQIGILSDNRSTLWLLDRNTILQFTPSENYNVVGVAVYEKTQDRGPIFQAEWIFKKSSCLKFPRNWL